MTVKNCTGQKFGRLTVTADAKIPLALRREAGQRMRNRYVRCRCDCGKSTAVRVDHLRSGKTRSCGCLGREMQWNQQLAAAWKDVAPVLAQDVQQEHEQLLLASADMETRAPVTAAQSPQERPQGTRLERRWEMEPGQYQYMLTAQAGVCAICAEPPIIKALRVDHDHVTGKIRGLLCDACNWGLGHLKDSTHNLVAALIYLKKFQ